MKRIGITLKRHAPTILTFIGAAGTIATAIFASQGALKANEVLKNARKEKSENLSEWDEFALTAPCYIPAVGTGVVTLVCIFSANVLNHRQQASLMSAYSMLSVMHKEYVAKVKEIYGEEADELIEREIALDHAKQEKLPQPETGKQIFYISYGKRFFERTIEEVLYAEYHFNRNFTLRGYANLNEFFRFLELEEIPEGEAIGWSLEAGEAFYGYQWVDFEHRPYQMDDGMECISIDMPFEPTADYLGDFDDYGEELLERYREFDAKNSTHILKGGEAP